MLPGILIGIVLVAGLAVYCWWQNRPITPGALSRRAPLRPMMNLRKSMVCVAAGIVVVLCLGTVYFVKAYWPQRKAKATVIQPPAKLNASPAGAFLDKLPKEYNVSPKAPPADLPPKGVPVTPASPNGVVHAATPPPSQPGLSREDVARLLADERAKMQADQQAAIDKALAAAYADWTKRQASAAQASAQPMTTQGQAQPKEDGKPKKEWTWTGQREGVKDAKDAQPALTVDEQRELIRQAAAQELIKQANWAVPIDPRKTLYSTQSIPVKLLENVNSELPGSLVFEVTAPVFGFHGKGDEIIPKGAKIVGAVEGQAQYGQILVPVKVQQVQDVDTGAVIGVKAVMGNDWPDDFKVNNHYGKLILGAGLSAILNIGVQTAAGTPGRGQYYQDPVQSAASDATRDIQRSATSIIDRQLKVPPTITKAKGTFATIKLSDNYMFHHGPVVLD